MSLDRSALLTAQQALLAVRETVVLGHGTTAAFDHALANVREALTTSVVGSEKPPTDDNEYVTTAELATELQCSDRWAREIAKRIGIKVGNRWLVSKDALPQEEQEQ